MYKKSEVRVNMNQLARELGGRGGVNTCNVFGGQAALRALLVVIMDLM